MKKFNTKRLVAIGLLTAIHIVLSRFCSINAWNIKIGFSFVPLLVAGYLYGPLPAAVVGGLADFLGAILFPIGPYFPGFTLTCALSGALFGLLLHRRQTVLRIVGAAVVNQFVLGLLVNSFWISVLYGSPYGALLATRVIQSAILAPVEFVVMTAMTRGLARYRNEALA